MKSLWSPTGQFTPTIQKYTSIEDFKTPCVVFWKVGDDGGDAARKYINTLKELHMWSWYEPEYIKGASSSILFPVWVIAAISDPAFNEWGEISP